MLLEPELRRGPGPARHARRDVALDPERQVDRLGEQRVVRRIDQLEPRAEVRFDSLSPDRVVIPVITRRLPAELSLEVVRPGYRAERMELDVEADTETSVAVELESG